MKKFVLKNNKGFTMIEMLLSLSFLLIILALIPILIKSIYTLKDKAIDHTNYELIMFRKDLSEEIKDCKVIIDYSNTRIKCIRNKNSTEYTLLNSKIFKSINGKGNITLLNNVERLNIQQLHQNTLKLDLLIRKGDKKVHEEIYI
ncbi:competence type IV pilus minor pilin ComGF [Mammaliicoccus fleurettii]|uniref:competence type IV pilus minor pilin ComGF n=1 Tax=Mammaliicoccus fleurettii TaxID=150056 RepID=UPI001C4E63B6|nr:competence type IV pilus minor pilin ComGF [Mammaliicoccus fleurettii]MBW0764102.1 prepilin-type N-terminal cleavage/methylation domain-containing protein [Mammaliicoccus fleurettii]